MYYRMLQRRHLPCSKQSSVPGMSCQGPPTLGVLLLLPQSASNRKTPGISTGCLVCLIAFAKPRQQQSSPQQCT